MKNKLALIIIIVVLASSCSFSQWGWSQINTGISVNINDLASRNSGFWAVGNEGKIITSSNNGANWMVQPSGTTNNLNGIKFTQFFSYFYRGYIAGANGTILRSTNSGVSWNFINTGTSQNLNDVVELRDTLTVIAVGDNGTIMKSTNDGLTWMPRTSPVTNNLYAVCQSFMDVVVAVGAGGRIILSGNGGNNWVVVQSGTTNNLNSIESHNSYFANMVAAGDAGTVIKTSDGGASWGPLTSGTSQNLNKIQIAEIYYGVSSMYFTYYLAAGSNGTIITSTNLGLSWENRTTPVTVNLNSVCLRNMNTGFACGPNGTMIYTLSNHYYTDKKRMDANNIGTWFSNDGSYNINSAMPVSGFEFPKGSGKIARYASGLLIGAIIGLDTLVTMVHHSSNEFYPGYTDNSGIPHGRNDSNYRVYKLISGVSNSDRLRWPNALLGNSDQGAPVYFDNSSNTWKPLDFGTQTFFTAFTDSYPESHVHYSGGTNPLKADVKHLTFSVDTTGVMGNVIFHQYTIINRGALVWRDVYITLWTDDDIGDSWNDKVGCDSALKLGYTYNGTGADSGYGNLSPSVGFLLLRGAIVPTGNNSDTLRICSNKTKSYLTSVRDLGMTVFNFSMNADPYNPDPMVYFCAYRLMKGLTIDGYYRYHPEGYTTTLAYSGNPSPDSVSGWTQTTPGDMRSFLSTGPLNMNPGDTQVVVFAQVAGRGTSSWNSVTVIKQYCSLVKQFYDSCYSFVPISVQNQNEIAYQYSLYQNYPNPFNPKTKIVFTVPKRTLVKLEIYDIAGRLVSALTDMNFDRGRHSIEWDGTNYSSGVYFYKLSVFDASAPLSINYSETKKMVLIK